jgi:hypothetical protein
MFRKAAKPPVMHWGGVDGWKEDRQRGPPLGPILFIVPPWLRRPLSPFGGGRDHVRV